MIYTPVWFSDVLMAPASAVETLAIGLDRSHMAQEVFVKVSFMDTVRALGCQSVPAQNRWCHCAKVVPSLKFVLALRVFGVALRRSLGRMRRSVTVSGSYPRPLSRSNQPSHWQRRVPRW